MFIPSFSTVDRREVNDVRRIGLALARDRPNLLHDLTRALFLSQLSIHSAVIATYGEQAVDVFYVKDLFGHKITHPGKIAAIERALLDAMGGGGVKPRRPAKG